MSKIIINGKSDGALKAYKGDDGIAAMCAGDSLAYRKMETGTQPEPPAEPSYLCFTAGDEAVAISMTKKGTPSFTPVIYTSSDAENWTQWDLSDKTINPGEKLYMYGENNRFGASESNGWKFVMTGGTVAASGDITTLLTNDGTSELTATYTFAYLFEQCTSLTTAPALPATTLTTSCYKSIFNGCTSLTTAPALPATTLVNSCYNNMFRGCTSLITAPALPATTLVDNCYQNMFYGCTSLTAGPDLRHVTATKILCCSGMFNGCTSLTTAYAPDVATWTTSQFTNWLASVAATGTLYATAQTAPLIPLNATNGCPSGWTVATAS